MLVLSISPAASFFLNLRQNDSGNVGQIHASKPDACILRGGHETNQVGETSAGSSNTNIASYCIGKNNGNSFEIEFQLVFTLAQRLVTLLVGGSRI